MKQFSKYGKTTHRIKKVKLDKQSELRERLRGFWIQIAGSKFEKNLVKV